MSRIGNAEIEIPAGVELKIEAGNLVKSKGPKGEMIQQIDPEMLIEQDGAIVRVKRPTEQKRHKAMHGLSRTLIANMVQGVHEGFSIQLELVGVGYRANNTGQLLELALGFSHPVFFYVPHEVKVEAETKKGSNPIVTLTSCDKQLVGQIAAKIRAFRKPEPYKGKGIKFVGEQIRRKAGKTAG